VSAKQVNNAIQRILMKWPLDCSMYFSLSNVYFNLMEGAGIKSLFLFLYEINDFI